MANHFALVKQLHDVLKERSLKIAVAESCTGGALGAALTSISGSSKWFEVGYITYCNEAKKKLLQVPDEILTHHGAVSAETAEAMAMGALAQSTADLTLSITGIAGPTGGTPDKPVGTVWFGLANRQHNSCQTQLKYFQSGRQFIRDSATSFALRWMLKYIKQL